MVLRHGLFAGDRIVVVDLAQGFQDVAAFVRKVRRRFDEVPAAGTAREMGCGRDPISLAERNRIPCGVIRFYFTTMSPLSDTTGA